MCFHELVFCLLWIARSDSPTDAVRMPITILIVDDEQSIRKLIRVVLRGSVDAVFLEANDAAEGLKIARQHRGPLDLLISDVVMPGRMNGIEMAAQLSQARQEMKIILMSGYAPEALTMGPDWHFIQKPFAVSEILERIASILADHWVAA
jgi:two-component system cell cycle sensor histidine kinase/response regulator CckA